MTKKRRTKTTRPATHGADREVMLQLQCLTTASYAALRRARDYVVYCDGRMVRVTQAQVNSIATPAPAKRRPSC